MKTLVYTIRKGGVGKTTLAVHAGFHFNERDLSVLYLDLDAQGNSSYCLSDHAVEGITASEFFDAKPLPSFEPKPGINLIQADKALDLVDRAEMSAILNFVRNLRSLSDKFDVCVIDTAPGKTIRSTAALFAADYVVSPVEVESFSVLGTKELLQDIVGIQKRRQENNAGELVFLGMLPNKVNNTSPMHLANLKLMVTSYAKYMLPCKVSTRTSIGEALAAKRPVWTLEKSAAREAAKEVRHAMTEIETRMGLGKKGKVKA